MLLLAVSIDQNSLCRCLSSVLHTESARLGDEEIQTIQAIGLRYRLLCVLCDSLEATSSEVTVLGPMRALKINSNNRPDLFNRPTEKKKKPIQQQMCSDGESQTGSLT